MLEIITRLFDPSGFPRRWDCGDWSDELGWLHILSDLGVWSAYVAIPCVLGYFVMRKKDVPFRRSSGCSARSSWRAARRT